MAKELTKEQLNGVIKCLHKIWYEGDFIKNPNDAVALHQHLSVLFNHAGIKGTLVENNPGGLTADEFLERTKRVEPTVNISDIIEIVSQHAKPEGQNEH